MKRGILMVAFGPGMVQMAEYAINRAREHTNLPFAVGCNKTEDVALLQGYKDVYPRLFKLAQSNNRRAKLSAFHWTPFEETLMLDCDSFIQNPGIEEAFELLSHVDILLNLNFRWEIGEKVVRIYFEAMKKTGVTLPLDVYNGAFIGFRKTQGAERFFKKWVEIWKQLGCHREMPALNCALRKCGHVDLAVAPSHIFEPTYKRPEAIVQHCYGGTFWDDIKVSRPRFVKPRTAKDDFRWVADVDEICSSKKNDL